MERTVDLNDENRELTAAELDAADGGRLSHVYLYTVAVSNPALFVAAMGMFAYGVATN